MDWLIHHVEMVDEDGRELDRDAVLGHTHDEHGAHVDDVGAGEVDVVAAGADEGVAGPDLAESTAASDADTIDPDDTLRRAESATPGHTDDETTQDHPQSEEDTD